MLFRARLRGIPIISTQCDDATWAAARRESRSGGAHLLLACCDSAGIAKLSPRKTRYFAHKPGATKCDRVNESLDHLELKHAVELAVVGFGWSAMAEACERDIDDAFDVPDRGRFEIDVLAIKGRALVALEVQLSRQGDAETKRREAAYLKAAVAPFWFVAPCNDGDNFGSERRIAIEGDTLDARCTAITREVQALLARIERQVAMATAAKRAIQGAGWTCSIESLGRLPVVIEAARSGARQSIVLGELGAGVLPQWPGHIARRHQQFAGCVVQLHSVAEPIRGFEAAAIRMTPDRIEADVRQHLQPILAGHRQWRGRKFKLALPAALVGYVDSCVGCGLEYRHVPYFVAGHTERLEAMDVLVAPIAELRFEDFKAVAQPAGADGDFDFGEFRSTRELRGGRATLEQRCSHCGRLARDPVISLAEASRWPAEHVEFRYSVAVPGSGWGPPLAWHKRHAPSEVAWKAMIAARRIARDNLARQERDRLEVADRALRAGIEERRRLAEEEAVRRKQLEAERAKEARRERAAWHEAGKLQRERERQAAARQCLRTAATAHFADEGLADMWLYGKNPKLRFQAPWDYCLGGAGEMAACLALLKTRRR